MQQLSFRAMGSAITVIIDSDDSAARSALTAARKTFLRYERILSRFRPHSELSALNRHAGHGPVRVGQTLWRAVQQALWAARLSDGWVTPAVGAALIAAGYDRDFSALANGSAAGESKPAPDWRLIECDPRRRTISLPAGMQLDFGGSAKGWTAALVARRLGRRFPALVDAGGDIAVSGPRRDGSPWPVEVADPHAPDQGLELLLIRRGGVATSGIDYRRWQQAGRWQHHLINPHTGAPAVTDLLSVTVVAPTLPLAEMAAKTVLLRGAENGLRWLQARPHLAALLVSTDGHVIRTPALEHYCWRDPCPVSGG
ncbi:thiamine biosynthesis protein ApbE [Chloroflexus islandicus]|uniref:FAD:protein FMN transferase n=1 Tax=Chloroflexus islandicus TaxID=1707952 RepID=A0A178M5P9_9CHLR|nr:FAD:protein FMN transferase [Chloroflexus islandicus]OAN42875.1 thiamine biosynthesis protein ApbE [Chloroflexus islandicus]